jgi:hypothetical protein
VSAAFDVLIALLGTAAIIGLLAGTIIAVLDALEDWEA